MGSRIGELLVRSGIIKESQLEEALGLQKSKNKRLGEILVELGYMTSRDLIWILSEQASIPFIDVHPEVLDRRLINSIPEKFLYDHCLLPLYSFEDKVYVALGDPTNTAAISELKGFVKKDIVVSATDPEIIFQLLDKFFLAERTETILQPDQFYGKIIINATDNNAKVQFVDGKGKIIIKNAQADIAVKIDEVPSRQSKGKGRDANG